jgi:hypothetical protein
LAGGPLSIYESFEAPVKWLHIDRVHDETFTYPETVVALPYDLALDLVDWAECNEERARAIVGAPSANPPVQ